MTQNAGMGWEPRCPAPTRISHPQHPGRYPRPDGTPDRAGLSHRPLGGRAAHASRRPGVQGQWHHPLCGLCHRPLRWAQPGNRWHDGQPPLSQRCRHCLAPSGALVAHAERRNGRCHLRQGAARHDARPRRPTQLAHHPRPWRRHPPPRREGEDAGKIQTIGVRFAHGEITVEEASDLGCKSCASPGGGCQFLGTAATSQVVAEALGMSLVHSALAPSGQPIWLDLAKRSAQALIHLFKHGRTTADILTEDAIHNAMVVHAAFGGSTNLLLHIPAIAHAAGLPRPTVDDWVAHQPQRAAPGRCPAQRPGRSSHRPGLHGRWRAGSHAASARTRPAPPQRPHRP